MARAVLEERWLPLVGWEGKYWVSNLGEVRGRKGKLKQWSRRNGYSVVSLEKGKKGKDRVSIFMLVHRAVANTFIPNPNHLPQVNHIDEDPKNNRADNLEWCTAKYNMNYGEGARTRHLKINYNSPRIKAASRLNGLKRAKPVVQLTRSGKKVATYSSISGASKHTGIDLAHIAAVANKDKLRSTAGGFKWAFTKGGVL